MEIYLNQQTTGADPELLKGGVVSQLQESKFRVTVWALRELFACFSVYI